MHWKNSINKKVPRKKIITFRITPQTHVRATQGDKILFRIPEDQLRPEGLKRKLRLMQYNEYKRDLREIAKFLNYTMQPAGTRLIFFIPCSKSWRPGKKKAMHGQPHLFKPDWDNFAKAFQDALTKKDSGVWDVRVTKFWTNSEDGRIEVTHSSIR